MCVHSGNGGREEQDRERVQLNHTESKLLERAYRKILFLEIVTKVKKLSIAEIIK